MVLIDFIFCSGTKMSAYIYKTDAEHNPTSGHNIAFSCLKKKKRQTVHSKTLFCSHLLFICSCLYLCVWIVASKPHAETNKRTDLTNHCVLDEIKAGFFFTTMKRALRHLFSPFLAFNCCKFRKFWCKMSAKHCPFTPTKGLLNCESVLIGTWSSMMD